ncbi:MAG: GntR family transcriptional regulator [Aquisalimonadaceae bacterium]
MKTETCLQSNPRNGLRSHQPLYVQIKETLRQRILDGTYLPHDRLPSESELMRAFGVSRITIRQALRDLHNEGLVFSAQGKGSFVSKPKAVQNIQRLEGFAEAMAAKGYEATAKLISIQERRPARSVAAALELSAGEDVVEVCRVRYLNRQPVSLDLSFFPLDIGHRLFRHDLTGDIFPLLENALGIPLGAADIRIDAALADGDGIRHLNLKLGEPLLQVERLTYTADGRPVDFEYLRFRGDSYQYQFRVERKPGETG